MTKQNQKFLLLGGGYPKAMRTSKTKGGSKELLTTVAAWPCSCCKSLTSLAGVLGQTGPFLQQFVCLCVYIILPAHPTSTQRSGMWSLTILVRRRFRLDRGFFQYFVCLCMYYKNNNTLQLWDRIFCRNSFLQAVCDTPIARITGCVSHQG